MTTKAARKQCCRCKAELPRDEFWRNSRTPDGLDHKCKACDRRRKADGAFEIRRTHGISKEQYEAILEAQDGGCAICGAKQYETTKRRLHVDHDHKTGMIRGLLCSRCNVAIGQFQDDPSRLLRAVAYLRKPTTKKAGSSLRMKEEAK